MRSLVGARVERPDALEMKRVKMGYIILQRETDDFNILRAVREEMAHHVFSAFSNSADNAKPSISSSDM